MSYQTICLESPRVKSDSERKKPAASDNNDDDDLEGVDPAGQSLEVDEDEMIDVAEKIFVKIADQIIQQKVTVRSLLQRHIFPAEIDGDQYELIAPQGLIQAIEALGIDDLDGREI